MSGPASPVQGGGNNPADTIKKLLEEIANNAGQATNSSGQGQQPDAKQFLNAALKVMGGGLLG